MTIIIFKWNMTKFWLLLLILRNKIQNQQVLLDQIDKTQSDNADLRSRLQRLETQYEAFADGERELVSLNERLENEAETLRVGAQRACEALLRDREQVRRNLHTQRIKTICNFSVRSL